MVRSLASTLRRAASVHYYSALQA